MEKIQIFITGGTFNKFYDIVQQQLLLRTSNLNEILNDGRCTLDIISEELMLKDSLDINDEDIEFIIEKIAECPLNKIVITHGTDRMCQHSETIAKRFYNTDKTIIFTGSIIPYSCMNSDARFNLTSALAFVQCMDPGIYIVMNGQCRPYWNVEKNYQTGYFNTIEERQ